MARKRKLDPFVSTFIDRHGKERFRFRRDGRSAYLPHPSSKEYRTAYKAALAGELGDEPRAKAGTIDALVASFYRSLKFRKGGEAWQHTVRQVLEPFREEFGKIDVRYFRPKDVEVILARKMEKKREGKRTVGGLSAAARLRDQLERLFRHAIKEELITSSPVPPAEEMPSHKGDGFHSWTEDEIAKFQKRHALGSKARLALEIMLWTGLRRGDTVKLGPQHIKGGRIILTAGKTGKVVDLRAAPPLLQAIEAMPAVGLTSLLVTDYGKPFTVAGFGGWFRDRCNEAGLPHCTSHGLRKALARRAADLGATQQQLKAVGQWSSDRDVATYTAAAEQRVLADAAIARVIEWRERDANIG